MSKNEIYSRVYATKIMYGNSHGIAHYWATKVSEEQGI